MEINVKKALSVLILSLAMNLTQPAVATPRSHPQFQTDPALPIADSRCQLSSSNSTFDYGNQSRWQLKETQSMRYGLTPGKRQLMVSVVCPYTQSIYLNIRGDRTPDGNFLYGRRGRLNMRLMEVQLDGQSTQVVLSTPEGKIKGASVNDLLLQPDQTFTPAIGNQPLQGKSFSARFEIEPVLSESDTRVSDRQSSEATLTLELLPSSATSSD